MAGNHLWGVQWNDYDPVDVAVKVVADLVRNGTDDTTWDQAGSRLLEALVNFGQEVLSRTDLNLTQLGVPQDVERAARRSRLSGRTDQQARTAVATVGAVIALVEHNFLPDRARQVAESGREGSEQIMRGEFPGQSPRWATEDAVLASYAALFCVEAIARTTPDDGPQL